MGVHLLLLQFSQKCHTLLYIPLIKDVLKYLEPKFVGQARASPYRDYWKTSCLVSGSCKKT